MIRLIDYSGFNSCLRQYFLSTSLNHINSVMASLLHYTRVSIEERSLVLGQYCTQRLCPACYPSNDLVLCQRLCIDSKLQLVCRTSSCCRPAAVLAFLLGFKFTISINSSWSGDWRFSYNRNKLVLQHSCPEITGS